MRTTIFPRTAAIRAAVLFWILLIAGSILLGTQINGFTYDENYSKWESVVTTTIFNLFIVAVGTLRFKATMTQASAARKNIQEDLTGFRIAYGHYIYAWNLFLGACALVLAICVYGAFLPAALRAGFTFFSLITYMFAYWFSDKYLVWAFSAYSIAMQEREKEPEAQESDATTEKGGQP